MKCLYCGNEMVITVNWTYLFTKTPPVYLCKDCLEALEPITGETCAKCDRPFEGLDPQYRMNNICYDCHRWEDDQEWNGLLERNHSIFLYNDHLKNIIAQYKFRGDYILAKAFTSYIQQKIRIIDYDYLTPIPLSEERQYERGFNQAEALITESGFKPIHLLQRTHTEKQSKKSRDDRIHLKQVFQLTQNIEIQNKKIVLIDDIYTTGSTLRHAAKVLKEAGAMTVTSLTLARG